MNPLLQAIQLRAKRRAGQRADGFTELEPGLSVSKPKVRGEPAPEPIEMPPLDLSAPPTRVRDLRPPEERGRPDLFRRPDEQHNWVSNPLLRSRLLAAGGQNPMQQALLRRLLSRGMVG